MERIPIYLIALIAAIANTPLDIFDVHAWNLGTVRAESWRLKRRSVKAAVDSFRTRLQRFWTSHEQVLVATAALIILLVMAPHYPHASGLGAVAVAGHMNIDALERDLLKKSGEAVSLLEKTARECQAYEEKDKEGKVLVKGRLMSDDEKKAIQALIDQGNAIKAQIVSAKGDANLSTEIERLTAGMPRSSGDHPPTSRVIKSLGQQWVESEGGQFFLKGHHKGRSNWSAPIAELMEVRSATLTSDAASGGDLVVSDFRPGISVPLLFKKLTVRDLLSQGSTDSSSVTYMSETTFTNAAAPVAEGGTKPESTLIFDAVTDTVRKIAHWLPVTEEMLQDVSQIRSYIDARLRLGVELTEEDQLLNGSGVAPNILGILNRTGLTAAQARAADTNIDAIFKEMMKIFNASFIMPDAHVINPTNWQTIQLSKDGQQQYYGSGPFAGPQAPTLWGLPVDVTPSIVANTALTGAFKMGAQIFDHGGLRVEASNSHADFFVKNLVAIRAERRLALAVYRPAAFGTTTGLN